MAVPLLPQRWPEPDLASPSASPGVPAGAQVIVVRNDDDGQAVRGWLKQFQDITTRELPCPQVLVRPTPSAVDQATLALDLLVALGKNPETLVGERIGTAVWDHARAWLAAAAVTDLVVDRAHHLAVDRLRDLAGLAAWLRCRVWLIWSGSGDLDAVSAAAQEARARWTSIGPDLLDRLLRLPSRLVPSGSRLASRVLPAAEFTTFRAACRRHLSPSEFADVDGIYLDAAGRVDRWIERHHRLRGQGRQAFGAELAVWLRDEQLGPVADPGAALVTLRATQAALFIRGVLLRWDPALLGADPARRLPGTIDPNRLPHDLYAGARTAPAAITALSLHLNQPPLYFDCWRVDDVPANGSTVSPRVTRHYHQAPQYLSEPDYRDAIEATSGVEEIPCQHAIRLPRPAHVLLAAHRTYRLLQGAQVTDPLFTAPRTGEQATHTGLRATAARTVARLHQTPQWLHGDDCRYGGDIGLNRRVFGWLIERGLSVHLLDLGLLDGLAHPLRHEGGP